MSLSRLEAEYGDPLAALDHITLAIRNCLDSGNVTIIRNPLAMLAAVLDGLGRHESAATIAGFADSPSLQWDPPQSPLRSRTCEMSFGARPTTRSPATVRR